ncbi:hypothetical protein [Desulfovibrio sp. TomC]|uniref:hypothetical protein n=1 Tax=Desulfovibrio sp. TomC TaxID=1562888 RepID=UPI0005741C0D|nr:hypothetical protein [Desulfovibrio sp. TomC]KHK03792.1 hypothetical protein NY78_0848 [Desulfovibrio sp. TomC]
MTTRRPTNRLYLACGLLWLVVAAAAAACDWPTATRLAEQRYRMALLTANAVDKTFLPTFAVEGDDLDGPYQRLAADFTARFGPRFNVAAIEARHNAALAGLTGDRWRIVCFTLAATAAIWWLLATIRAVLPPPFGRP